MIFLCNWSHGVDNVDNSKAPPHQAQCIQPFKEMVL